METIKIIAKTSIAKITIIKRKIRKSLNSKKIKPSLNSSLKRIRIRIATTKSKKLLER